MTYQHRPDYVAPDPDRCQAIVPGHPSWNYEWMRHDHQCPRKANQMRGLHRVCYQHAAMKRPPRYAGMKQEKTMTEEFEPKALVGDVWRHVRRDINYEIIDIVTMQSDGDTDGKEVLIYRALSGKPTWAMMSTEFHDGRFAFVSTKRKPFWSDAQWAKVPLVLKQKWWQETDYGDQPPSDALLAEMKSAIGEA